MLDTMDELVTRLNHVDGTQRRMAALRLGALRDARVGEVLINRLSVEDDARVREDLTWSLVQHIEEVSDLLLAMLDSADPGQRRTGAHVVSKLNSPTYFEAVRPLVADPHPDVALKAYRAVANSGDPRAAEVLAMALGRGDQWQRDGLSAAFQRLGAAAVEALVCALDDSEASVREHAAEILGYLGLEAASGADALMRVAACDTDPDTRLAAVSALGQLGEAALPALTELSTNEDPLVASVARAHRAA